VLDAFGSARAAPRPARWEDVADRINNPEGEVRVAIVGKYTQLEDAYKSIAEALTHGGMANRVKVKAEWIDAEMFEREDPAPYLEGFRRHPRARRLRRARRRRARSRPPEFARTARCPISASASACRWR
jgi:CTP synthase